MNAAEILLTYASTLRYYFVIDQFMLFGSDITPGPMRAPTAPAILSIFLSTSSSLWPWTESHLWSKNRLSLKTNGCIVHALMQFNANFCYYITHLSLVPVSGIHYKVSMNLSVRARFDRLKSRFVTGVNRDWCWMLSCASENCEAGQAATYANRRF